MKTGNFVLALTAASLLCSTAANTRESAVQAKKGDTVVESVKASEPLPSWNDGPAKERILNFIKAITDKNSENFVPFADRYATFDNDGTILCEKPTFFEVIYTRDRVRALKDKHPEWEKNAAMQKLIKATDNELGSIHTNSTMQLMAETNDGLNEESRRAAAQAWLNTAKHPRFGVLYKKLHYQPMIELMELLRLNGFKIFLCSGGQAEFMRCYAQDEYDIAPPNVIGSSLELEYSLKSGRAEVVALPKMQFFNVADNKPITISQHIGKRPVIACGNSDGDLQMLSYASDRKGPALSIVIHHDDANREYAYDNYTQNILPLAAERNWLVVSMKNDFKKVFSLAK